MSSGRTGRGWESLRGLPNRTPLRVKLITAVLALVIIALGVISFASRVVYGDYLQRQANTRLADYYNQVEGSANAWLSSGHGRLAFIANDGLDRLWLLDSRGQQISLGQGPNGEEIGTAGPPPQVPASQAWLTSNAGKAVTLPGQSGGSWLVITQQISGVQVQNLSTGTATTETVTLVVGTDLGNINQAIEYLTYIDLLVSGAVIVILAIAGVAVVRASLRPLTDIEKTAGTIAAGDLTRRVPERDPRTEVGRLGRSLNAMLSQIEAAFDARATSESAARQSEDRMRRFVADASHELRTPLTAIRGYAEYYRQRGGLDETSDAPAQPALDSGADGASRAATASPGHANGGPGGGELAREDLDRIMQRVEQESARMGVLVEDMLLLARLDQQRPLERRPVDMLTLAADAVHDARVMAPDRSINLTVKAGTALLVLGDEVRLRQVIGNLMSNALNHTPDGTPITARVRLGSLDEWRTAAAKTGGHPPDTSWSPPDTSGPPAGTGGSAAGTGGSAAADGTRTAFAVAGSTGEPFPAVVFEVTDHGLGITPDQAEHVFERFYRGDQARTRKAGGTGLGLSIVAALVTAHGGTVWVESPPGGGATFRIAVPLAPEARLSAPEPDEEPSDVIESRLPSVPGHAVAAPASPPTG